PSGNGGAVTLAVTGDVEVGYDVFAAGGMKPTETGGTGKNGGNVTIVAGGSVSVGDAIPLEASATKLPARARALCRIPGSSASIRRGGPRDTPTPLPKIRPPATAATFISRPAKAASIFHWARSPTAARRS